ncbi:MAG: NAD(P)(+) transhydrogenase (Re/Si-specific) subunit alpha, partial [Myxococcota bacterium]
MVSVFIPKEVDADETRVAATPDTVKRLNKAGFTVWVEKNAGERSFFHDQAYRDVGAQITEDAAQGFAQADVVLKLQPPTMRSSINKHEADMVKEGALWIGFLWPRNDKSTVERLSKRKVTSFAMDMVPRISRAQSMDALSSQSNLAGYKAVLMAADTLAKPFPMMMTAAGT